MTTLGEVFLYLRGDDKHLEATLDGAKTKTTNAAGDMAKMLGGALVAGAAVAGAAIVGIGSKAFDVASDIEAATDQIGASLGLSGDEAKKYGDVIKAVYGDNFGDSIGDVGSAVENVAKQLKLAADDPSLPKLTSNAFRLRYVFGTEVNESVDAAKTLMENFGLSGDEAFDMIAAGYQRGFDRSGDFLDTIGEYSNQFAQGGASAGDFFSIIEAGAQGGILGTDKAADAFKEFQIRIADGSKTTSDALAEIGLSVGTITEGLSLGTLSVVDVWDQVQAALQATDDPITKMNAGVALMGTQFEDLTADVASNMATTEDWAAGTEGAINTLDLKYSSLGSVIEGMWRKFQMGIAPAGEAMLGFVNDNLPAIEGVVKSVSDAVAGFINAIPAALLGIKTGWDEDWAGMRTTVTTFSTESQDELEEMWLNIRALFVAEGDGTEADWEEVWRAVSTTASSWILIILGVVSSRLEALKLGWFAITAAIQGDWETFWVNVKAFAENHLRLITDIVDRVFRTEIGDAIVNGLNDAWERMKGVWANISGWWASTFGGLLGMGGSIPVPDLAVVNPLNQPGGAQNIVDDILGGFDNSRFHGNSFPGAGTNLGGVNITQQFYGQADREVVQSATEDGVLRASRNMGMR